MLKSIKKTFKKVMKIIDSAKNAKFADGNPSSYHRNVLEMTLRNIKEECPEYHELINKAVELVDPVYEIIEAHKIELPRQEEEYFA